MKKQLAIVACILSLVLATGCDAFEVEKKTLIDYRHTDQCMTYETNDDGITTSKINKEEFELMYEYTYADGHTERKWEECTRFEYAKAKEELGEIEP